MANLLDTVHRFWFEVCDRPPSCASRLVRSRCTRWLQMTWRYRVDLGWISWSPLPLDTWGSQQFCSLLNPERAREAWDNRYKPRWGRVPGTLHSCQPHKPAIFENNSISCYRIVWIFVTDAKQCILAHRAICTSWAQKGMHWRGKGCFQIL